LPDGQKPLFLLNLNLQTENPDMKISAPKMSALLLLMLVLLFPPILTAQEDEEDLGRVAAWRTLTDDERGEVMSFAEDYKDFMSRAKTELSFVAETVRAAEAAGFSELTGNSDLRPGARFYDINRDRTISLIVVGSDEFTDGFRVVGAHVDSTETWAKRPSAL